MKQSDIKKKKSKFDEFQTELVTVTTAGSFDDYNDFGLQLNLWKKDRERIKDAKAIRVNRDITPLKHRTNDESKVWRMKKITKAKINKLIESKVIGNTYSSINARRASKSPSPELSLVQPSLKWLEERSDSINFPRTIHRLEENKRSSSVKPPISTHLPNLRARATIKKFQSRQASIETKNSIPRIIAKPRMIKLRKQTDPTDA